jgi:hypothetical protein
VGQRHDRSTRLQGHGEAVPVIVLTQREKEDLHGVLRRSLERAEKRARASRDPCADAEVAMLTRAVADLDDELAGY